MEQFSSASTSIRVNGLGSENFAFTVCTLTRNKYFQMLKYHEEQKCKPVLQITYFMYLFRVELL